MERVIGCDCGRIRDHFSSRTKLQREAIFKLMLAKSGSRHRLARRKGVSAGARRQSLILNNLLYNSFLVNYCRAQELLVSQTKRIETSQLTAHIGFWMRLVSNSVSQNFARKLESSGVTVAEWVVLREMYSNNDETSPSTIAEKTGLTRGAISKLISRLLEKGLVSLKESTNDRRYQDIKLTTKAVSLVPKLASLADKNDEEFFLGISKTERIQLTGLLKKLANHHKIKTVPTE